MIQNKPVNKINFFQVVLVLGLVIRFVFAVTTYHSDLGAFALAGKYIVGENKWFSFYDTIASKDASGKMIVHRTDMVFNYQPLAYLLPSVVYLPFRNIVNSSGDKLINRNWLESDPSFIRPILLLYKLPLIVADLFILWLLPRFFKSKKSKQMAQLLWVLNPLAIYVSSVMGQVDIIIAAFIASALYSYKFKRYYLTAVLIALSALIKPAGIILLPLLGITLFVQGFNIKKWLGAPLLGVFVYLLGILPYLGSASYRYYALFAEQINKSTYAGISIASGTDISYFFIALGVIALLLYLKKISFFTSVGIALLSSLALTHFHPQWLVWIMPWLIIFSLKRNNFMPYLILVICWFGVLFSFDASLHLQTFLHSSASIPVGVSTSSFFKEAIQLARAGIVSTLLIIPSVKRNKI